MVNYRNYIDWAEKLVCLCEERSHDTKGLLASSILLSWIAIESFVNNMMDDFVSLPEDLFQLHERAFLLERENVFLDTGDSFGTFQLGQRQYVRLSDKILFLIRKFNPTEKSFKGDALWQDFEELRNLRNRIAHPRRTDSPSMSSAEAEKAIATSKSIIIFISEKVWGRSIDF